MSIHEFLLKVVVNDIAILEGITNDHFLKELKQEEIFHENYDKEDYSHLLLLLAQLVPIVNREGIELKNYKDFLKIELKEEEWEEMSQRFIYYSSKEISTKADDRVEPYEIENYLRRLFGNENLQQYNKIKNNLEATVLIIHQKYVVEYGDQHYRIKANPLFKRRKKSGGARPRGNQAFGRQYSASSSGTGFFIQMGGAKENYENKYVATAAHVLRINDQSIPPKDFLYIRNFGLDLPVLEIIDEEGITDQWVLIPKREVYYSKAVKPQKESYNGSDLDWAIVEVESNEMTGNFPPAFVLPDKDFLAEETTSENEPFLEGEQTPRFVYGIGHGLGLSHKFHFDANIKENVHKYYFKCCLDFFSGNSGSPVFDSKSHKVLGILFKGNEDFVEDGTFLKMKQEDCEKTNGEYCQRISLLEEETADDIQKKPLAQKAGEGIEGKRLYAPYLYLAKEENADKILLFVLIPHQEDECFTFTKKVESLMTVITYNLVTENCTNPKEYYDNVHNLGAYHADKTVKVKVKFGQGDDELYQGFLRFDENDVLTEYPGGVSIANNAPYIYLTKPKSSNPNKYYSPRMLLPLDGYKIQNQEVVHRNTVNSDYHFKIDLEEATYSKVEDQLLINSEDIVYQDISAKATDGFVLEVTLKGNVLTDKKRKAKIRNANADIKPNDWIPFFGK